MNQTLEDLANQLRKIDDDKAVIQSLIKRVDVLESTPDATKEMLSEYARDFDTLDATVKGIITGINKYQDNENAVLRSIQDTVEHYHWIINQSTLEGLKRLVEHETGFSLQNYVSKIQASVINKEFDRLHKALISQVKPVVSTILDQADQIKKLQQETLDKTQELNDKTDNLKDVVVVLSLAVIAVMLACFLAGFGLLVNAFVHHPVISSVLFALLLGFVGYMGYWLKQNYNQVKTQNESDDNNETEY